MQITFVSNYINHHQTPVSDELYRLVGDGYTFVQTEPMEEERISMGWDKSAAERPYVKLYYKDRKVCDELIMSSDCVIFWRMRGRKHYYAETGSRTVYGSVFGEYL